MHALPDERKLFSRASAVRCLILLLTLVAGCPAKRLVARVGPYTISRGESELRGRVLTLLSGSGEKPASGLEDLIYSFQLAYVARDQGVDLDEPRLVEEAARIDRQTERPEILAKVKEIFGGDEAAYRKLYVLPELTLRVIYSEAFARSPSLQAEAMRAPLRFLEEAADHPASFASIATRRGLALGTWRVTARGITPRGDTAREIARAMTSEAAALVKLVAELAPGKVYPKPVDVGDRWLAVRLLRDDRRRGQYDIAVVTFPKANFQEWIARETAKVPVERY